MKEIDFLPEWYKSGRRRQISYRTQYVGLAGIFAVLMVWSFAAGHSLSMARAELSRMVSEQAAAAGASQQFAEISNSVRHLRKKAGILEKTDSRIDVASVLAEMSFLLNNRIVLNKVDFKAESFENRQGGKATVNGSPVIRRANSHLGNNKATSVGDVKFKIVLNGVAADASEVAKLVCRLEESPYFCMVYPSFSRNKKIAVTKEAPAKDFEVTEFEIGCYLANFHESVGDG
ncbi:MAG: hypothetical protein ACYSTF_02425 [Planctomycetota bacterium]|jgi:hypothetical protein